MTRPRTELPRLTEDGHGIIRDEAGIVVAMRDRHPLADLFRWVPMGASNLPGMGIQPELQHLLAIHVFSNLRCDYDPERALYDYREPKRRAGMHATAGGVWVPKGVQDDEAFAESEDSVTIPDPTGWTPQKLAAMKTAVRAEEIKQKAVEQADPHITTRAEAGEK